jgi:hypothetical protein
MWFMWELFSVENSCLPWAIALESLKVLLTAEKAGMRAESRENTLGNRRKTSFFDQ